MLRLFRNIRKKLLADGSAARYLLYALGEIALVVIGILLALAINNANEDRVTRKKEQVYLAGLRSDFALSKAKLEELIHVNRQNYEGARQIAAYMSSERERPSEKAFSHLLYNAFANDITFNPNNSLLEEMISSGSLKDIHNTELRRRLTNWSAFLVDIEQQEAELDDQRNQLLQYIYSNNYSLRTVLDLTGVSEEVVGLNPRADKHSNLALLDSRAFENHLVVFILTSVLTETAHYEPLLKEIDLISGLLDAEIKS